MLTKPHLSNECRDIHWVCCKSHPKHHSGFHVQELSHKILQLFMLIQGSCTWNDRVGESSVLNKLKTENSNSNTYPSPKDTYKSVHSRSVGRRPIIEAIQILMPCRMDQYTMGGGYLYSRIQHSDEKKQTNVPRSNMENITNMRLSEKSQICIHTYCMNPFIVYKQTEATNSTSVRS